MRILIIILTMFLVNAGAIAQQSPSIAGTDSATASLFQKGYWNQLAVTGKVALKNDIDFFDLDYRIGVAYYRRKMYAQSEKYFRKAFSLYPTKDLAQYIYYGLLLRGLNSEAEVFNQKYQAISEVPNHFKKGAESLFFNIGQRFSTDQSLSGNLLYSDFGRLSRPNPKISLYQSVYYLQQNNPNGNFKQLEYFISRESYNKNGWYLTPSLHYALTLYSNTISESSPYADSANWPVPPFSMITVRTNGTQVDKYSIAGITHSMNPAFAINKRKGPFTFVLEPALQIIYDKHQVNSSYTTTGQTDSFFNGYHILSHPYYDSTGFTMDTSTISYTGQLGASVSYIWPIKGAPLFSRLSFYYLFDNNGNKATAWNFYSLITAGNKLWVHFSCSNKGALPWAFNQEGQYFNTYNTIKSRMSLTLQFKPLKRFSPMLTYQLENDTRASDNKAISYHSIYLTFKYNI